MKALSLHQPYAAAFALGHKRNETRSWKTSFRGPLAIHATKKSPADNADLFVCDSFDSEELKKTRDLSGVILGVCEVLDCVPVEEIREILSERERGFGVYTDGRFAWICAKHQRIFTPIACGGARQLWTVPQEVEAEIERQLAEQSRALCENLAKTFGGRGRGARLHPLYRRKFRC